jgi:hypothetical protein
MSCATAHRRENRITCSANSGTKKFRGIWHEETTVASILLNYTMTGGTPSKYISTGNVSSDPISGWEPLSELHLVKRDAISAQQS